MPRFALLKHETPPGYVRRAHFDLVLEGEAACRTWALSQLPGGPEPISAEALPDHRHVYLDYEGEVSGGRGTVTRIDSGTFQWIVDSPARVVLKVKGSRMQGKLSLVLRKGSDWTCTFQPES